MTAKKKITRKQLLKEPDEFITTTGRLIRFGQAHRRPIAYVAGAVLVVLLVVTGTRYYLAAGENRAFSMLGRAMAAYDARVRDVGVEQAYGDVRPDFEDLLERYGGNRGGKAARLIFAGIAYDAGDYDRAAALYERSLRAFEGEPFFEKLITSGLVHALQAKNETARAVDYLNERVRGSGDYLKDEALFLLGQWYRQAGDAEKSGEAFRRIVSDYPDSIYVKIVSEPTSG